MRDRCVFEDEHSAEGSRGIPNEIHCDTSTLQSLILGDDVLRVLTPAAYDDWRHNDETTPPLFSALANGDWDDVLFMLEREPVEACMWQYGLEMQDRLHQDVDDICPEPQLWKRLPLHHACRYGAPPHVIKAVCEAYPQALSSRDPYGGSFPLHLACHPGRYIDGQYVQASCSKHSVSCLLEQYPGAAKQPDAGGRLPLHYACMHDWGSNTTTIVQLLINANPSAVCAQDHWEKTPLDYFGNKENVGLTEESQTTAALMQNLQRLFNRVEKRKQSSPRIPLVIVTNGL